MSTTIPARIASVNVRLLKVVRFMTVNIHIPAAESAKVTIMQGGEKVTGVPVYKGAVWFVDGDGKTYVSFVNKSTALWQAVREADTNTAYTINAKVKELRSADEHGPERHIVTHVKLVA